MALSHSGDGLLQTMGDNIDGNISSQNGLQYTHSLAILLTQVNINQTSVSAEQDEAIKSLKKKEMKCEIAPDILI